MQNAECIMQNEKKSTFSDIISEKVLFFNLRLRYQPRK